METTLVVVIATGARQFAQNPWLGTGHPCHLQWSIRMEIYQAICPATHFIVELVSVFTNMTVKYNYFYRGSSTFLLSRGLKLVASNHNIFTPFEMILIEYRQRQNYFPQSEQFCASLLRAAKLISITLQQRGDVTSFTKFRLSWHLKNWYHSKSETYFQSRF